MSMENVNICFLRHILASGRSPFDDQSSVRLFIQSTYSFCVKVEINADRVCELCICFFR